MDLIQKANKLGYKHYTEFTVEELDNLSLENSNKQIEYYFIQKWLREEHHIIVEPLIFNKGFLENDKFCYQWRVYDNTEDWFTGLEFKTYEEALEMGLQEALKLI